MRTWLMTLILTLSGVVSPGWSASGRAVAPAHATIVLPPTGTDLDYQLGGVAAVPAHVGIVVRDRTAAPAAAAYSICYVNGFQTQPNERRFWRRHWALVLKHGGRPVVDEAWGEWLLDLRTPAKRQRLAEIMGRWVRGCAHDGFAAVEFDNLDSYTRSGHRLTGRQATRYARLLVAAAHAAGLAAGQKNRAGWNGTEVGYDFAIAEECGRWHECRDYVADYGDQVLVIEYRRADFDVTCAHWGERLPVVLRDLDLTPTGVHEWC